jgi:hypothetical protein
VGTIRASYPRFARAAQAPSVALTADDVAILRLVFRHRFIRADDLYRLFSGRSADKISRRLVRLYRSGYLDRPIAQIDRFRPGGSRALVYGLASKGARYLAEVEGTAIGSGDWKTRNRTYTRENLDHTLAITRFLVDLELACRDHEEVDLIPGEEIIGSAPVRATRLAPFVRWTVPVSWSGMSGTVYVAPDSLFGLRIRQAEGQTQRSFVFLEIDRGTMTIAPARQVRECEAFLYRATILRKLLTYAESYRQGLHREHLGIPTARVLLLTSTEARAAAMQGAADRFITASGKIPAGLFLFGTMEGATDVLSREYRDAAGRPARLLPAK